jgi:sporulation-control protein
MGLFSKVKAAAGIGASSVKVELEQGTYHWGETVRGKITVEGGEVEQSASAVVVYVTETWEEVDSDGDRETRSRNYNDQTLAQQVVLAVGSRQEWPFAVPLPPHASLTSEWSVGARVKVAGAVDRHGAAGFTLLAPRAVLALSQALCRIADCELKSFANKNEKITVELRPLPQRRKDLDGLTLTVKDDGQQVAGTLEINPQEKSLADRLKALAKKDRVYHNVAFDSPSLAASETDAPANVVEQLQSWLAPHLSFGG